MLLAKKAASTSNQNFMVIFHFDGDEPQLIRVVAPTESKAQKLATKHIKSIDKETEFYIDSITLEVDVQTISAAD